MTLPDSIFELVTIAINEEGSPRGIRKARIDRIMVLSTYFRQYDVEEKLLDVIHHAQDLKNNHINNLVPVFNLEQLQEYSILNGVWCRYTTKSLGRYNASIKKSTIRGIS